MLLFVLSQSKSSSVLILPTISCRINWSWLFQVILITWKLQKHLCLLRYSYHVSSLVQYVWIHTRMVICRQWSSKRLSKSRVNSQWDTVLPNPSIWPAEIQQQILYYTDIIAQALCSGITKKDVLFSSMSMARCFWCSTLWWKQVLSNGIPFLLFRLYATLSPKRVFPGLSQSLKTQAEYVFYAQNKFNIDLQEPDFYLPSSSSAANWKPEASQFLSPSTLKYLHLIHHLRWRFPEMDDTCFLPGQPMTINFTNTLDFIADKPHSRPSH